MALTAVGVSATAAFADAAGPSATITATSVTNDDGTVTVTVSGSWQWGSEQCPVTDRYALGWAIDWSDSSTPYTLSHNGVTFQTGNAYDGYTRAFCNGIPDGRPAGGTWSASHTYSSTSEVPKEDCVNFYDVHTGPPTEQNPDDSNWAPAPDPNSPYKNTYDTDNTISDGQYSSSANCTDIVLTSARVTGPTGATGAAGATGATGARGATGATGSQG
ncbi:MAG TPA: hypothetical protein VNE21_02395, partial [Mycobacteriales bacterium]|nr:hypothetical protein [Mycobacteriales bacterium]